MVAGLFALATVGGVGYYMYRLAPRVLNRMQTGGGAAAVGHGAYRSYVYGFDKVMTDREARLVLGFDEAATSPPHAKVREHYRQVMAHLHSDVGGSPYIATKINEARDVLLKR